MATYQTIFKCRLCGKLFNGVTTDSERIALDTTASACLGKESEVIEAPRLNRDHLCADGSYGVADFQGYKKMNYSK